MVFVELLIELVGFILHFFCHDKLANNADQDSQSHSVLECIGWCSLVATLAVAIPWGIMSLYQYFWR